MEAVCGNLDRTSKEGSECRANNRCHRGMAAELLKLVVLGDFDSVTEFGMFDETRQHRACVSQRFCETGMQE